MNPIRLNHCYRGFEIGYVEVPFGPGLVGFTPTYSSSLDSGWVIARVAAQDMEHLVELAEEIIDFQYRCEAASLWMGRELTYHEMDPKNGLI